MITIRPETPREAPIIEALIMTAFKDHPHQDPNKGCVEHLIVYKLRQANALPISLIALDQHSIVGHIAFSPITIDGTDQQWFALAPVAVLPSHQNQGIGTQLIEAGLALLKERNADGCVVLGEPDYYQRFGFLPQNSITIDNAPQNYFMAQSFTGAELPKGLAQFHPAFAV